MIKSAAWGLILSFLFLATDLSAQGPGRGHGFGRRGCIDLEAIGLSEAQKKAFLEIDNRYRDRLVAKRKELMVKRIEIQDLFRNPDAEESAIRQKSFELGTLHDQIRESMIEYQIEIRGILNPDQIRRWCTLVGVGLKQEW